MRLLQKRREKEAVGMNVKMTTMTVVQEDQGMRALTRQDREVPEVMDTTTGDMNLTGLEMTGGSTATECTIVRVVLATGNERRWGVICKHGTSTGMMGQF